MSILPWRWKIFRGKKPPLHAIDPTSDPNYQKTMAGPPVKVKKVKKVKKRKGTKATADHRDIAERVNCIHLKPPSKGINRWRCERGFGPNQQVVPADCDIFLGKDDNCQFHVIKFKPLTEEQIEAEIDKRHVRESFVKRCVEVRLCPNDGHDLRVTEGDDGRGGVLDLLRCPICNFEKWIN